MQAKDLMTKPAVTILKTATLEEAAAMMLRGRFGSLPVVDEQSSELCGIITESDFAAKQAGVPFSTLMLPQLFGEWLGNEVEPLMEKARKMHVADVMSRHVMVAHEDDSIPKILRLMLQHNVRRLPVLRNMIPVGIITRRDLLRLMAPNVAPPQASK